MAVEKAVENFDVMKRAEECAESLRKAQKQLGHLLRLRRKQWLKNKKFSVDTVIFFSGQLNK